MASIVQQVSGSFSSSDFFTTTAVTSDPANVLVAIIGRSGGSGSAVTSVVDSKGVAWSRLTRGAVSGESNTRCELWYTLQPQGGLSAQSVNIYLGGSQPITCNIVEVSGLDKTNLVDTVSPDGSGGSFSTNQSTPSLATTNGTDLIISVISHSGTGADTFLSTGTQLNSVANGTSFRTSAGYYQTTSIGSYDGDWKLTSSAYTGHITVALRLTASGLGGTGTRASAVAVTASGRAAVTADRASSVGITAFGGLAGFTSGPATPRTVSVTIGASGGVLGTGSFRDSGRTIPGAAPGVWRYIAQNILDGSFVHFDLPIKRDELRWDLSGPGALRGTITPVDPQLIVDGEPVLQEWRTAIYAEIDDEIRWGGILTRSTFTGGGWAIECSGFSNYPAGIPYTGALYSKVQFDPTQIFADIWAHVQAQPDGNLGVTVAGVGSPIRVGIPAQPATGTVEGAEAEPYELAWWEAPDCGNELDNLAKETPFDYVEEHAWVGDAISHTIRISFPRVGATRRDLLFVEGANVTRVVEVARDGDNFTNHAIFLGKGEGATRIRAETPVRDGRLRRPFVISDATIDTVPRATALARRTQGTRNLLPSISSITVTDHPSAPFGSWRVGDDIRVRADLAWLGWTEIWCRITSWALETETTATLTLARSDSFTYGGQSYATQVIEPVGDWSGTTGGAGGPSGGGTTGVSGFANYQAVADAFGSYAAIDALYASYLDLS